jgi:hypothetical protein
MHVLFLCLNPQCMHTALPDAMATTTCSGNVAPGTPAAQNNEQQHLDRFHADDALLGPLPLSPKPDILRCLPGGSVQAFVQTTTIAVPSAYAGQ